MDLMDNITMLLYNSYVDSIEKNSYLNKVDARYGSQIGDIDLLIKEYGGNVEFYDLYIGSNGYNLDWSGELDGYVCGRIRIMKFEHVLQGLRHLDSAIEEDEELYHFHPIDLMSDEANCGVFMDEKKKIEDRMFYHYLGEMEVYDLHLSFLSYLKLANACHGYSYWPKYILELISGESSLASEDFKRKMPVLFPKFSLEKFNSMFEELRIK